ncbi:phosphatidate cytidylyltransferase [candidate division KSB1 bacterium]|nr:phosphatidate cytidylyltransferase [candidate division KSB1 bacterium]
MTTNDVLGLVLSYVYAFSLLLAVEKIGEWLRWPQPLTRKVVHIGAGMWVWAIIGLFDHWWAGIIPFATFIGLNYLFYRRQTFHQMDQKDSTLGTVYFAISITFLMSWFWRGDGPIDRLPVAVAGIMAMTWGDAFASLVGEKWGSRRWSIFTSDRTLQGSLAMLVFSFAAVFLTLVILPESSWSPYSAAVPLPQAFYAAIAAAISATVAEMVTPAGMDNLTVPIGSSLVLLLVLP